MPVATKDKQSTVLSECYAYKYNNDQHGNTFLIIEWYNSYLGTKQYLYNEDYGLLNSKKVIPVKKNPANHPEMVGLWILKKKIILTLSKTSIVLNSILNTILIPTKKYKFHPSSKKIYLTEEGEFYKKKIQFLKMQKNLIFRISGQAQHL